MWVLEAFEESSLEVCRRWSLPGFADSDAAALLGREQLGYADLYDVTIDAAEHLGRRFHLDVEPDRFYFLIGREAP